MSDTACYDFNANYFDLPFTNELKPVSKNAQAEIHVIVYARECSRGYMVFSSAHKHFLFKNSKACKQMIEALEAYTYTKESSAVIQYTLSAAGIPQYASIPCEDGRYWIEDITGFSFMAASWNGRSISEASNPFLVPGARGETEHSRDAQGESSGQTEPEDKRKSKRG
jgi:hypothetical protein